MADARFLPPHLDAKLCEQARLTRDPRFDGLFFVAVTSTRIFCRPVCPAPSPKPRHVVYYPSAAAAAAAGFRPCLRCRPELAPGASAWRGGDALVASALRLIEDGLLDEAPVAALAARVGVGERHLRRLFAEQLGAGPLAVAATRRLLAAKKLLHETRLPVGAVAHAAGYASLRRFNAAFRDAYGIAPRELRRGRALPADAGELRLRLPYRPPYDFAGLQAFFARRAIPGVEAVDETAYRRVFMHGGVPGWFEVSALADAPALLLRVRHPQPAALLAVATRVRRMFDLDADAGAIAAHLGRSATLRPLLRRHAGVRVPGCWDGFEVAVRAVLGQQVSVAAARTLASRLVERYGTRLDADAAQGLHALFPSPAVLADADPTAIGVTRARAETIRRLARAVASGEVDFRAEQGLPAFVEAWSALPGIGAWTAHYVALRALGHPDAFPAADLVLRKVAGGGAPLATRALQALAEDWRPWRAYATMLLWRGAG
ncbi:3-methyladenine DNA glycosylase/8-oxoguanine DNAglycosylase [Mizugakiibacter sediminis]|uniref:DNA-3-methyladenine glycosylase II n=1 Tax=Mizugakiibacter sediminis TaxID=1475481 RepID=A0A0K8QK76_9GAMM|nr:DNA-3-methyladenine glycosylase 2 [Mizugakiibacter sediminis]GAP65219.1 3-methyladenine DNA glycosylase/8-oxoguanine DNAglycosylase [Mizugakiibacter sediminis]